MNSQPTHLQPLSTQTKVSRFLMNWLLLTIVWIGFTGTFDLHELLTGIVVAGILSFMAIRIFTCCDLALLAPKKLFYLGKFIVVFLVALVKSNFDMARRVLSPALPINPGVVKFKSQLKSNFAKMVLANAITLTPGTLSIDVIDDTFYIHWIDVKSADPEVAFKEIAEDFENLLIKIF
ncbi:MAG TPA: Na+/H+ antiporter subunit E [Saprospiraceae bacterium]|nr:Na+/H+ antiporter subunit E [Saprospiraceae bacterium]